MKTKTHRFAVLLIAVFALATVFVALPAAAQDCSNVSYRLWTQGGETWYRLGDTVEIESGTEGHIYMHVDSKSESPYSTNAEIGYPENFGYRGIRSTDVARHLFMKAPTADDRKNGRIRFDAKEPGTTQLGFRLVGVKDPGSLDLVSGRCRTGAIPIRVLARGGGGQNQGGGGHGHGGGNQGDGNQGGHDHGSDDSNLQADRAAEELVSRLYRGLLRRPEAGDISESFVNLMRRGAINGAQQVAESMLTSSEFRRDALRRTEEAHGRREISELRYQLLNDIYRDLYGYSEPDQRGRQDDLRDLEDCLTTSRGNSVACSRLGRELVSRAPYYEYNRDLIDALAAWGRPGRR